jgi:hypothetical protein
MNAARSIVAFGTSENLIRFGARSTFSTGLVKGIMTPAEAYSMDLKLDDGIGGSGFMVASYDASDASVVPVRCVNSLASPTRIYNVQFSEPTCVIYFRLN